MGTIARLTSGTLPIRVSRFPWLEVQEDDEEIAVFRDSRTGISHWWQFHVGLPLDLDPRHRERHRHVTDHHVRWLFERRWEEMGALLPRQRAARPRTDEGWSPLLSLDAVGLPGGEAALVLHRLDYEPGRETVVGHLLVPCQAGLFEWRWFAATDRLQPRPSDAPEHDASFPGHVLSLARSTAREIVLGRELPGPAVSVLAPPPAAPGDPARLGVTRCSLSLPPRFLPTGGLEHEGLLMDTFARVSYSGIDGVDRLLVQRTAARLPADDPAALAAHAEQQSVRFYRQAHATEVTAQHKQPLAPGHATVIVTARGHLGPLQGALDWWVDPQGSVWNAQVLSTTALPEGELLADLATVTTSWRLAG